MRSGARRAIVGVCAAALVWSGAMSAQASILQFFGLGMQPTRGNYGIDEVDGVPTGTPICTTGIAPTGNQTGYDGQTYPQGEQYPGLGQEPTVFPPGTYWQVGASGDDWGYIPQDPSLPPTPPSVTTVPNGATTLAFSTYWVSPAGAGTFQPPTAVACSDAYETHFAGTVVQWAQPAMQCSDTSGGQTPFLQYIQNLSTDTPQTLQGVSDEFQENEALQAAWQAAYPELENATAEQIALFAIKEMVGSGSWTTAVSDVALDTVEAAVGGYLADLDDQTSVLANTSFDYFTDGGTWGQYWSPANSQISDGNLLAIAAANVDPFTDYAAIAATCVSSPATQGWVLDMFDLTNSGTADEVVQSYYGSPAGSTAAGSSASAARVAGPGATADMRRGVRHPTPQRDTLISWRNKSWHTKALRGNDDVHGGWKSDRLDGARGHDTVEGGDSFTQRRHTARDILRGGPGRDLVVDTGGPGNRLFGGPGNDRIAASSPSRVPDVIRCGTGEDLVLAGRNDRIAADCEHVYFHGRGMPRTLREIMAEPRNWPIRGRG